MKLNIKNLDRLTLFGVLLIIAMVFSPFTQLRLSAIGVAELLCFIIILFVLFSTRNQVDLRTKNYFIFTKFWIIFLAFSSLGLLNNFIISDQYSGNISGIIYDGLSYLFVAIVCFCVEIIIRNYHEINLWNILKKIYIFSSVIFLFFFVLSYYTNQFFGFRIDYYGFFRPLATNIHHISMAIAPLPFIGLKIFAKDKKIINKLFFLGLVASNIIIANNTGSLKVLMGFIIGLFIFLLILILKKMNKKVIRLIFLFILSISIVIVAFIFTEQIAGYLQEIFISNDISGARETIYSSSIVKILESPIVGFGPGQHAEYRFGQFLDAHQSFLTIALQGGLLALLFYIFLHLKIIKSSLNDPYILGSYAGIFIYALCVDIIRRLPMWIFLILFYYFCMFEKRPRLIKNNFYNQELDT